MDQAAQTGEGTPSGDSASSQAPQVIPKYRFDEVSAQLRAAREQIELQQQILNQARPNPANQGPSVEDLGLDSQTVKGVETLIAHKLKQAESQIQGAFAGMQNRLDETQFLLNQGKEKAKMVPAIREKQKQHFQLTGAFLGMEEAYKILMFDEMQAQQVRKAASAAPAVQTPGAQEPASQAQGQGGGVPDSAQTKQTQGNAGTANKPFHEMTLEEQEAHLAKTYAGQMI